MSEHLEIRALGGLSILRDTQTVTGFDARKVPALLVYLACNPRPHSREVLAEMLWEDRTQTQSLSNLRAALTNLRKTVGPFVDITRETVSICADREVWTDTIVFEEYLVQQNIHDALTLYRGDFLEGFTIDSQGFEDWIFLERERLRLCAISALDTLITQHLHQGEFTQGIARATQLLHMDSLREKTFHQFIQLLALSGEREAALAQYETCRQMLHTEFGVQPTPETTDLYQRICAGEIMGERTLSPVVAAPVKLVPQQPKHNLPIQATSFVGREPDIAAVMEMLEKPDCRLVTLVGSGGIGKTRLALAVAERLQSRFTHGAFFVPLASLTSSSAIVPSIGTHLQFQFYPSPDTIEQQLINFLHGKEMLLVLDNFEHLLDGAELVDRILTAAPDITIIITSREPLNLTWEWLYEVAGMPYPTRTESDHLEDYSAVRLFIERARRVQRHFRLSDECTNVIRICQLVEGMPLGIEITAAWLRIMSCEAIVTNLLDLDSFQGDIPERHRSLRALFDHIWQRLSSQEQEALMKLSIFRSSFTSQAAEIVAQVPFYLVARLVNQSLLSYDLPTGRYTFHAAFRQYAAERFALEPTAESVRAAHSEFFLETLCEQESQLAGPNEQAAFDKIRMEFDDILQSWTWAVSQERFPLMHRAGAPLIQFLLSRQRWKEALALAEDTLSRIDRELLTREHGSCLARMLNLKAACLGLGGSSNVDYIEQLLQRSLTLSHHLEDSACILLNYGRLAEVALRHGDYSAAERLFSEALAAARIYGNPIDILLQLYALAGFLRYIGRKKEALPFQQEASAISEKLGSPSMILMCQILHAQLSDNPIEEKQFYEKALGYARTLEWKGAVAQILCLIGASSALSEDYQEAHRAFTESLIMAREIGFQNFEATLTINLGLVACELGDFEDARLYFQAALNHLTCYFDKSAILPTMVGIARLLAHNGKREQSLRVIAVVMKHTLDPATEHLAKMILVRLKNELPDETFESVLSQDYTIDLQVLAVELLRELEQNTPE